MTQNSIREVRVRDRTVDPAQAELWISVIPERSSATAAVSGRLAGPRCAGRITVEVAYPLRPLVRPVQGLPGITQRVVIPEPSLWAPDSPFLYEGPVELWEDGQRVHRRQIAHGLRTLHLGARGLRLNGGPLTLRGRIAKGPADDEKAQRLPQQGYNLLLAPVDAAALWPTGDRFGLLLLGRLKGPDDLAAAAELSSHTATLGFVIPDDLVMESGRWAEQWAVVRAELPVLLGVELSRRPAHALPAEVDFLVCRQELLAELGSLPGPKVVVRSADEPANGQGDGPGEILDLLGWIEA